MSPVMFSFAKSACPRFLLTNNVCFLARELVCVIGRREMIKTYSQRFCSNVPKPAKKSVFVYFVDRDGDRLKAVANVGESLLDVAVNNDVELEGACEGTLACSTCHLIFKQANYDSMPDTPTDEELDMLDLAFDLQQTSRLGCQVIVTEDMDGWEIKIPSGIADAREPS